MASIISAGTTSGTSLNLSGDTSGVLQLATNGSTTAVTVDTSQNVGIGTTSPATKLQISESGAGPTVTLNRLGDTSGNAVIRSTGSTGTINASITLGGGSDNLMTFATGSTASERMRINSAGALLVGTTSSTVYYNSTQTYTASAVLKTNVSNEVCELVLINGNNDFGTTIDFARTNSASNDVRFAVMGGAPTNNTAGSEAGYLYFSTKGSSDSNIVEHMRITPSGFVKASNTGSYNNVGSSTHEFNTNISNDYAFYVGATNASYAADGLTISFTQRSAANSFAAWKVYTTGGNTLAYLRGDGNAYTDGTWNNNGADYAEFFESVTGQAIPVGSTVVLENNKVRIATQSDNPTDVIGVVRPKEPSKASMIIGNTAWNKWANKYLTDDFDRYIMEDHDVVEWTDEDGKQHSYESNNIPEDITVPADAIIKTHDEKGIKFQHYKLNPAWDPNAEYVNRENRDEWLIIGLVGQVKVLKGQVMGDRWKKMRDVSSSVEEWFIR